MRTYKKVNTQVFTFGILRPLYQPGYYPFWFEFSQHFAWFHRFGSRENVQTFKVLTGWLSVVDRTAAPRRNVSQNSPMSHSKVLLMRPRPRHQQPGISQHHHRRHVMTACNSYSSVSSDSQRRHCRVNIVFVDAGLRDTSCNCRVGPSCGDVNSAVQFSADLQHHSSPVCSLSVCLSVCVYVFFASHTEQWQTVSIVGLSMLIFAANAYRCHRVVSC